MPEFPDQGALTGTATVGAGGSTAIDPGGWGLTGAPKFLVLSGPCTVSESGRCVGRARGYTPDEACAIVVGGGLGVLEPCGVFDTVMDDYVTLPDGSRHHNADCPAGVALSPGGAVGWASDSQFQGSVGRFENGCTAAGSCGLRYNEAGIGGGWQLCFAV